MFTALPAIAVLAVLGALLAIGHRDGSVEDRTRESAELAASAALNARGYLEDRYDVLAAIAAAPDFRLGSPRLHDFMADAGEASGNDSVTLIDSKGVIRASGVTPPGAPPIDVSDRQYVKRVLSGRPAVSDVLISRVTHRPTLVFAYPTGGGAVGAGVRLDLVSTALRRQLGDGATVVDAAGNIVVGDRPVMRLEPAPAAYPLARMRAERKGALRRGDLLLGFSTIDETGWIVVTERDYSAVIGPLDRALWLELGALLLFAGLGVALTFATARRLDRLDREREEALSEQREIALTLQRSMLPDLIVPEGLTVSAHYVPAQGAVAVGGDWYDLVDVGDGRVVLDVGDVAGHGLRAAVAMGKLRSAARAEGLKASPPAQALTALDRFATSLTDKQLATVAYAVLDLTTGRLRYGLAGHPPPLLIEADGTTSYLEGGRSPLLGVPPVAPRAEGEATLAPGDVLVIYTDGLVERPEASIDEGLATLARRAATLTGDIATMADRLVATVTEPRRDDAAVLVVRREPQPSSVAS